MMLHSRVHFKPVMVLQVWFFSHSNLICFSFRIWVVVSEFTVEEVCMTRSELRMEAGGTGAT